MISKKSSRRYLRCSFERTGLTQAALTPSLGGLGLRCVVDHANGAFAASWEESQATARESWVRPAQVEAHKGSQTQASLAFDKAVHAKLVAEAPSQREKQRLGRLVAEHAGAWVTAVPSKVEGSDCVMSPAVFRTAVRYRLGVPVARPDARCSFCMQPFDLNGDHASCCKKNADIIVRHNRIRNLVSKMADEGLLSPVLEKRGILGDTKRPGRRPGDVTFPCWQNSKGLAVDVCVTSPFNTKNLSSKTPADDYGLRKHGKYDEGFSGTNFSFCALALETTGGVSEEGLSFLRQLWRFAARQQNTKLCVYAARAWARLSCNLQTSVAQAILHRIPTGGHVPVKPTPSEVSVVSVDGVDVATETSPHVTVSPASSVSSVSPVSISSVSSISSARVSSPVSSLSVSFASSVSPVSSGSKTSFHTGSQAWSPLFKDLLAKRGLLSVDAREMKEGKGQLSSICSSSVLNSLLASVTAGHDSYRFSELDCGVMATRLETIAKPNLESKDGPVSSLSVSSSVLLSCSSPHRLASVGACLPGDSTAVQDSYRFSDLDRGLGGAATRLETVIKDAPQIPGKSEGRGPQPPSTTDQSFTPSSFKNLFPSSSVQSERK